MTRRRTLLKLAAAGATLFVIAVLGLLLLPRLIDSQWVKQKIALVLAEKIHGTPALGRVDIRWFPRPTLTITDMVASFDETTQAEIRSVTVYPSIMHLLVGQVVLRRMQLQAPQIKVHLPAPSQQPLDSAKLESDLRSVVSYFTTELSGLRIDIADGSVAITRGDEPAMVLDRLNGEAVASSDELRFAWSAGANLFRQIQVKGEIAKGSLAGRLAADVEKLQLKEIGAALPVDLPEYLEQGEGSFALTIEALGLKKISAEIAKASASLVLARRGAKMNLHATGLKAQMVYDQGIIEAGVEQLEFDQPRLKASAKLKMQSGSSALRIQLQGLDIGELRPQALLMAGDLPAVKKLFEILQAGSVPEIIFDSAGASLAELAEAKNVVVTGSLSRGRVAIPRPALDLQNVTGSMRIAAGILEAKDLAANLGDMRGWDGKLRMGLDGTRGLFHVDIAVQSGAGDLRPLLLKIVDDQRLRGELMKLRNVTGELSGRLILGERLDAIAPMVSVSKLAITADYDPIRFPIMIRSGGLNYGKGIIRLDGLQGAVGQSTFAGLNAIVHNDVSSRIKIESGRFSLDLAEMDTLLRGFQDFRSYLVKLKSARGKLELASVAVEGVLNDPANWHFTGMGEVRQVSIAHADVPGPITLSRGKFVASDAKVTFSETTVGMLDGSVIVGGSVERSKALPVNLRAKGSGVVGAQMSQWLSLQLQLPKDLQVRTPLKITAGEMAWRSAGDFSFRGKVDLAGGAQISLDAVGDSRQLRVRELIIEDDGRHAHFKANLLKDSMDVSFKGLVTEQTVDKIFTSFPYKGSLLKGDLQLKASLESPRQFSAQGLLEGANLLLPWERDKALIKNFRIEAAGTSLQIRTADVRWRNSRLTMSGKVAGMKEAVRLDVDVAADRLDWAELERFVAEKDVTQHEKARRNGSLLGLEGKIRFKSESFTFAGYQVSPLQATVDLSPSGLKADIDQSMACGISAAGKIDVVGGKVGLDIRLTAKEAQLKPTSVCLTDGKFDASGTYSMVARVTGRGNQESLLPSLKGTFNLSARDGEVVRSAATDATFDYLNATGDFKVAFPDLDKQAVPYRLIRLRGRVDGADLINDEVIVQLATLTMTGQGKLDLRQRRVDAKGLVSVSLPGNQVVKYIPLIGDLVGGRLVGIPLRITGSLDRPDVSYLAPADVGRELVNMPLKILGAPLEAIRLFKPNVEARDKNSLQ